MRKPLPKDGKKKYVLKLYVTGATRRSQKAITNLNAICEEYLQGNYDLQVVDIYQSPVVAKDADILAAPTLVKQLPLPVRRLIGYDLPGLEHEPLREWRGQEAWRSVTPDVQGLPH